jgi:hypothetical protein
MEPAPNQTPSEADSLPPTEPNVPPEDLGRSPVQPPNSKSKKKWLWFGLVAILTAGSLGYWFLLRSDKPQALINSFDECVAAGYPVAESFPEQCIVPGGSSFTRQLSEEEQNNQQDIVQTKYLSKKGVELTVDSPLEGERVSSPFNVSGMVPGNWSFEGFFPIKLLDSLGNTLVETQGSLEGDWMTEELVPFSAEIEFSSDSGAAVTLVIVNDNPSGLAENDDSLSIEFMVE